MRPGTPSLYLSSTTTHSPPSLPLEFVCLYTDYLLNKAIYNQFASFYYGFHRVCTSNALQVSGPPSAVGGLHSPTALASHMLPPSPLPIQLFRPEEIELLVCGSPLLDLTALEDVAVYDGYSKGDSTVRWG